MTRTTAQVHSYRVTYMLGGVKQVHGVWEQADALAIFNRAKDEGHRPELTVQYEQPQTYTLQHISHFYASDPGDVDGDTISTVDVQAHNCRTARVRASERFDCSPDDVTITQCNGRRWRGQLRQY